MKYLWLILLIASSPANANCKPVQYEQKEEGVIAHSYSSEPGITIANSLWFPKLIKTGEIIVDKGPLIAIASNKSYVSYRQIEKMEMEFIGSKKSPYNFFKDAFTNPSATVECSFADGFRSAKNRSYYTGKGLEFFVHEMEKYTMVYILSRAADIVVEVTTKKLPSEAVSDIISKTYIK